MSKEDSRKNHTCLSCTRQIDSRDLASMQCGHPFHYQCLQVSLGDQIKACTYPVCCPIPNCFIEPSMYFMSVVLEEPIFKEYLILEKDNIQTFMNYECPVCDQSFLAYPQNQFHKCLKCYKIICLQCKNIAHPGKKCSEVSLTEKGINQLPQLKTPVPSKKQITDTSYSNTRSASVSKKHESEQMMHNHDSCEVKESDFSSCSSSAAKRPNSLRKYSTASTATNSAISSLTNTNTTNSKKNSIVSQNPVYVNNITSSRSKNIFQPINQQHRPLSKDIGIVIRESAMPMPFASLRKSNNSLSIQIINNGESKNNALNSIKKHSKVLQQKNSC